MGIWLTQAVLEAATSKQTVLACTDDDIVGVPNAATIALLISRAESKVLSYLSEYGPPPFSADVIAQLTADPFLQACAVNYGVALLYERHPEYVKAADGAKSARMKYADEEMERVLDARQRPPTVATKPKNVGGVIVNDGPRMYTTNADGSSNAGDY